MTLLSSIQNIYLSTKPKPWTPQKPEVLQFPVNDVCNSRCQMCNIWEQKFDYQISPKELEKALSNPLFSEVKTVGVNGGEPTLRKDLSELVDVLFRKLPKLSTIGLITNSFNSQQVIQRITEVGHIIKTHRGNFDVMVSLDGFAELHDKVRGRKGNFDNAVKVIDFIQNSELVHSRRLGCTVIKENILGVHDLLEFALSKDIYIKYRLGIPHQRLYSKNVIEPFDLSFEEKYHFAIFLENLINFYETSEAQIFFYKSLINQLIYQMPRQAGCDWQHKGATLSARGELLYCAVESKTLGSAISEDAEKLYFDNHEHLAEIVKNKCDSCTHDYVGMPTTKILLNNYVKSSFKKLGLSIQDLKSTKLFTQLRYIKEQENFKRRMSKYNIKGLNSKPATHFPKTITGKPKILICGWYGTETLGDKGILGGVIYALKASLGDIELHLVALEEYICEMTVRQMPELEGCTLHSVDNAVKIASLMDLVVFGGGPLMAIPNIADMAGIFQKAVDAKVPTLIAGCGVGPLGSSYHNEAIKSLLLLASHRIYRDKKSLELAKKLGVDTSADKIAEDPAFTWLKTCISEDILNKEERQTTSQPTLLLGLRDWPYFQYANKLSTKDAISIKENFEKEVIAALEQLSSKYSTLKIIPFPMCTNHIGDDDRWFYRDLFRKSSNLNHVLDLTYLGKEISPTEAVKVFKSSTVALTMRFHSLVFALSCEIPAVAVDYTLGSGKVKSLAEKYNVPYKSLDSINANFIVSSVSEIIDINTKMEQKSIENETLNFTNEVMNFVKNLY
jgi:polysaccharide pyruvyl transferase WcaK-like protein/sulfatase maturation enzyme AslB (radical SAM superfamily)